MYRGKVVDTLNGKRSKGLCDFLFYILFIYAVGGPQVDQGDSGFLTDAGHLFAPVHEETAQPVLESPLPGASAASSSHAAPKQPQTSANKQTQPASQKEGCYIATCVYGSYDCPQVRLLRRFRDEHMKKTPAGRIFIRLYYAVSPVLVLCFGKNPAFHVFWRHILDSLIRRLESGR